MSIRSPFKVALVALSVLAGLTEWAGAQTVRIAPIVRQTATPVGSEIFAGANPPASEIRVNTGSTFFVEIWASNVNLPLDGLACVHVDLTYDRTDLMDSVSPVQNSPLFSLGAVTPVFDDANGLVDDVGGCQSAPATAGLGVGEWVLVERIEMLATGVGGPINVLVADAANLFAGTSIIGQLNNVLPADILFGFRTFQIGDCIIDGDCDDGVTCTVDTCTAGLCSNVATDSLCDNGQFCDGAETCNVLLDCQAGTPVVTDDGVGCTVDTCDEVNDVVVNIANDGLCDNGQFCDGVETCDALLDCQAGTVVPIDDGVVCTVDICDEVNDIVVNTPTDSLCDNGIFCDGAETCDALLDCQVGTVVPIDDGVGCTVDSCDEVNDVVVNAPMDSLCDNGQFCDGAETCDALLDCLAGAPIDPNDAVTCTVDSCDEVNDVVVNTPTDSLCDDTLFCNGVETCDALLDCQAGTPVPFDDGVGCTVDSCDEVNDIVVNTPSDALCDDTFFCTGVETCDALLDCQAGTPVVFDDGVGCTVDSCDEVNDVVVNTPTDALCDDTFFCTGVETCDALLDCQAGTPVVFNDGISCTVDSCDEVNDVVVNAPTDALCDNGLFCDGVETCDALLDCQAGTLVPVDDAISCTVDSCDEVNDVVVNTPTDALCDNTLFCDGAEVCDALLDCLPGGDPCPLQGCDEVTDACVDCFIDSECDDGMFCNGLESCVAGACVAGVAPNCTDAVVCTIDTCDEVNDLCVNTVTDALCDNGLFCDGIETCDALLDCQAGTPPNCNDGVVCTTGDSCDEVNDVCVNTPDDTLCDDGAFCNGAETCDALLDCQLGTPPTCDDSVACTLDSCDTINNVCVNATDDTICDNGMFCDGAETCDALLDCQAGTPVVCDDLVGCTTDMCDEFNDACSFTADNTLCDNAQFCDGMETCDPMLDCQPGIVQTCDDSVSCTMDVCDEINDICTNTANDALCDNAQFCDGIETCDALLDCQTNVNLCTDNVSCTVDSCDEISDSCIFTPIPGCQSCVFDIDCNDGVPCTIDVCQGGACVITPSDTLCNNGQFCDGVEICQPLLGCMAGTPITCDDGVVCTSDSCNEIADVCLNITNDSACDDGQFCNGVETCSDQLGCLPGVTPCDDGVDCTVDACNELNNSCVPVPFDDQCDDGLFCNGTETCHPLFGCETGTLPCDDGIDCSLDACNEVTGECSRIFSDLLCDDGDDLNGIETCHPQLGCQPGMPQPIARIIPIVRQAASGLDLSINAPPVGTDQIQQGSTFVVELWAQQVIDPTNVQMSGLCCMFADLTFNGNVVTCNSVNPSADFGAFDTGTCGSNVVDELGGCTFNPPLGVTPQWARIATVNLTANTESFGNVVTAIPSNTPSSICQFGTVPISQMEFESSVPFRIGNPCMYDLDGDDCVGPGDIAFFAPCWLRSSADPLWTTFNCSSADFDCTGQVDPGDLAFFATAWLRCCDDPGIIFPPLPCGMAAGIALPPADRKMVEDFGLPYPDDDGVDAQRPTIGTDKPTANPGERVDATVKDVPVDKPRSSVGRASTGVRESAGLKR